MNSCLLLAIFFLLYFPFTLLSSSDCLLKSEKASPRVKSSANTQTFVLATLKRNLKDIPLLCLSRNPTDDQKRIEEHNAHNESYSLASLQERLLTNLFESSLFLVEETIIDLYDFFPEIDHINFLYYNPYSSSSRTISHFAVITFNADIFEFLAEYNIDPCITDSEGMTALELAFHENCFDELFSMIKSVKGCISCPFFGHASFVNFAASSGSVHYLKAIREAGHYDFGKAFANPKDSQYSPLELAFFNRKEMSIKYLMSIGAYSRPRRIQAIYLSCIKQTSSLKDLLYAIFMIKTFSSDLMYLVHPDEGSDIMLLALNREIRRIIAELMALGYDSEKNQMNMFNYTRTRITLAKYMKGGKPTNVISNHSG